jgi:hypothetical protein
MNKHNKFLILLAVAFLAGCKPDDKSTPPAPAAKVVEANNGNASIAPPVRAFGYVLGQPLNDPDTVVDPDGAGMSSFVQTTNFPPFDQLIIRALSDHRIYSIVGNYNGGNWSRNAGRFCWNCRESSAFHQIQT